MKCFSRFLALGDSMSIDKYPAAELEERGLGRIEDCGAVSLFRRNRDDRWPEFRRRDLVSNTRCLTTFDKTEDGYTTDEVLLSLRHVDACEDATVITLTVGGNDLVGAIGGRDQGPAREGNPVPEITDRFDEIVDRVLMMFPEGELILTTVYDPSDGLMILPPWFSEPNETVAGWLSDFNDHVRSRALKTSRCHLADVHQHFLGHGLAAPEKDRWYWRHMIIEPNSQGANEIRRMWWEAVERIPGV